MAGNSEVNDGLFGARARTASLFLISVAIAICMLVLVYFFKDFANTVVVDHGPLTNDCTLFASATASDDGSGMSPTSPLPFARAAALTRPGSVLCLIAGTYTLSSSFRPPTSGKPSFWIVYRSYGDGPVNFVWAGAANASSMFYFGDGSFPSDPAYLEFRGLNLDGQGNAADGFFCRGSHHLRFVSNSISNTGGSGIASIDCDYLTADHNLLSHNGYIPSSTSVPTDYSWTSGISFNSNQWFDNYAGFHNYISNNIVAGEVDQSSHHSDGNGIILDLSNGTYTPSTANTPPALIANNVVYGNGGRCIVAYVVSNFWMVNNTCYRNDLDPKLGNAGAITTSDSHDGYVINNIAVSYVTGHPPYEQVNSNTRISYYSNMYFGAANNFAYPEAEQLIEADPGFLNPPIFEVAMGEQYASTLAPSRLGDALKLRRSSPAIAKGIDASSLPGLPGTIVRDLKAHIYTDINGKARPQGGGVDLGAYQH
ncbi:MAG: right-handed parallel beta-helix repeat-containing protein [Candidatus Acidiferrum sp.]